MSSGRALKPALTLRPSSANRPGTASRAPSQGSLRSLSRSHTPTPSPSANSAAAEARCYFSIPSAASATTYEFGGGDGPKTATGKTRARPFDESHRLPHCRAWLHAPSVDTADVVFTTAAHAGASSLSHFGAANESPKRIGRSRPIAIDIRPARTSYGPTGTPPEPLSARGDLHG